MSNPAIRILEQKLLSDNWYKLWRYTYEYQHKDGTWETQQREAYDRGNGATILLYNPERGTVILTRQFRLPTYVNGNPDGRMIEACAGLLDQDNAEDAIRRETEEETGYRITSVQKVFEAYMSPGSVTEVLHFFVAAYSSADKINVGGGIAHEQENIEVMEMSFAQALEKVKSGEIRDAKTIMLLQYAQLHQLLRP